MAKASANSKCACHSGLKYKRCCGPFHRGKDPLIPLQLMRSRYCAYALGILDYIIKTTDKTGPHWRNDHLTWLTELRDFARSTKFKGLSIGEQERSDMRAWVTFDAHLEQDGRAVKMTEKSLFRQVNGRWLYHSGSDPNQR
ncbi:MAG: YchJ family metal-binding protein [Myxococcota bacterium]|nr:YchJ family metal-binding protein [Myxococcota bacterium]